MNWMNQFPITWTSSWLDVHPIGFDWKLEFVAHQMEITNKLQGLLIQLRTLKLSAKLRHNRNVKRSSLCVTRWSHKTDMLND